MIWLLLACLTPPPSAASSTVLSVRVQELAQQPLRGCVLEACALPADLGDPWFSTVEGDTWRGCVYVQQDDGAASIKDGDAEPLQVSPERFEQLAVDPEKLVALLP